MALLVLSLSCLPCADSGTMDAGKIKSEIVKQDDQDHHDDHEDACSPFCNCSCCAKFSIYYAWGVSEIPALANKNFMSFLSDNIIEVFAAVWQPPQLV